MKKIVLGVIILCSINANAQTFEWQSVGGGVWCNDLFYSVGNGCYVKSMVVDSIKNILYVGGEFDTIGGKYSFLIGSWNGSNWQSMPATNTGSANDMLIYNAQLALAADNGVSLWNGSSWKYIGGNKAVCVTLYNGDLIIGGEFTGVGWTDTFGKTHSITANSIARWHDTAWYPLGEGLTGIASPKVKTMEVYNGELYAGGNFDQSGSLPLHNIARWDGTQWKQVGGVGTNLSSGNFYGASVQSLKKVKNKLFAIGFFDSIGSKPYSGFSYWDGTNWNYFGMPFESHFYGILNNVDDSLYHTDMTSCVVEFNTVTGSFHNKGPCFGSLPKGAVRVIKYKGEFYAGGGFDTVGGIMLNNIARLVDITAVTKPEKQKSPELYPNPVTDELTISGFMFQPGDKVTVTDLLGRLMLSQTLSSSTQKITLQTQNLPSGIYFLRLNNRCSKFVKQ